MARSAIPAIQESQFNLRHNEQSAGHGKDVFLAWFALMFVAVIGAHFLLNVTPGTPTGFITAEQDPVENMSLLVDAFFVLFVTVLIGILGHWGITRHDR